MKTVLSDTYDAHVRRVRESKTLMEWLIKECVNLKAQRAELLLRIDELEKHGHDDLYWYRRYRELERKP